MFFVRRSPGVAPHLWDRGVNEQPGEAANGAADFATSAPGGSYLTGKLVKWGAESCKVAPEGGSVPSMMKAAVFLLLALLVPAWHAGAQCIIDNVVDLKVQTAISSIVSTTLAKAKLLCQDVSARGALVTCPGGYKPTSCACGMGCGSWDIRSDSTCHCQCRGIDWTSARCCKIGLQ